MKYLPTILSTLLGVMFIFFSSVVLFHLMKMPPPPPGPQSDYFAVMAPSGYFTFVKVMEFTGGILLLIPLLRNIGLLIIGPIIVNIVAFHVFIAQNAGSDIPMWIVVVLGLAVLISEHRAFRHLVTRPR